MPAPKIADRVKETTTTTGTGSYTLAGAVTGFRAFSSPFVDTDVVQYAIDDGTSWEVGYGTLSSSATVLSRVLIASSTGSLINWGAGTKTIWCNAPAREINSLRTMDGYGCTVSNNTTDATNDLDIAAGRWRSDDDIDDITLTALITKRLDANWVVGTNQGGLDTGSIANTSYHVFLIKRPDTGVVDVLFSASATAPTMPTNYTLKRRIASFVRASAAIVLFTQNGDHFMLNSPSTQTLGTSTGASTRALPVPTGVKFGALVQAYNDTAAQFGYLSDLAAANVAVTSSLWNYGAAIGAPSSLIVWTDTSAQIRQREAGGTGNLLLNTMGWIDNRGRIS